MLLCVHWMSTWATVSMLAIAMHVSIVCVNLLWSPSAPKWPKNEMLCSFKIGRLLVSTWTKTFLAATSNHCCNNVCVKVYFMLNANQH